MNNFLIQISNTELMFNLNLLHNRTIRSNYAIKFTGSFFFVLLNSIAAQIVIPLPFTPVPITFQTLIVLSSGIILGSTFGALSMIMYILLGMIGLPIFAGHNGGVEYLFEATAGYLIGFVFASFVTGLLVKRYRNSSYQNLLAISIIGSAIIYICGLTGLMIYFNEDIQTIAQIGLFPFIPGDTFKIILIVFISKSYLTHKQLIDEEQFTISRIIASLIIVTIFVLYLFSNNGMIPNNLAIISIFIVTSVIIINWNPISKYMLTSIN